MQWPQVNLRVPTGFKEEGFDSMGEKGILSLEKNALGPFRESYNRRYEQWKKKDLLIIAIQTMPKQVKNGEVLSILVKLRYEL